MKTPKLSTAVLLSALAVGWGFPSLLQGANLTANFDNNQLPTGAVIFGNDPWLPVIETGGVGDSPCLKLTKNVNSQYGSFIIPDLDNGAFVYGFKLNFMARVGAGTSTPADGWSICVAPDLPDGYWGEDGRGTGLVIQFDTYDNTDGDPNNGTGEAPQIRLRINNTTVAQTPLLPLSDLINSAFVPVEITLNADGSLDLTYNGKVHFSKLFFPNYQPLSGARFGFGARTGGLNANHWIDDLSLQTYLTPKPGFVTQPQSVTMIEGSAAQFSFSANNTDGATIQWLRDGTAIAGANDFTYTLSNVALADSGAKFSARLTLGGTVVTSAEATLTVVQIDVPSTPVVSYDFNSGLPVDVAVYGTGVAADGVTPWEPYVSASGGVNDSGVLQLTENQNSQSGAFLIPDQHNGAPVYGVAARFDVRIGGGSDVPADGMSFNFAADLPDGTAGDAEEGVGSGLRVCFDIYDNADGNPNNNTGEAPAITLKWAGAVVAEVKTALSDITTGDEFADVLVRLAPNGNLDVVWNGKVLVYQTPVPGFGSIANGRFGFFARTGGLNANQWVDNLRIYTYLSAPLRVSKQPTPTTVLVGNTATFNVELSRPEGATYQWFRDGTAIAGATASSYTTPATQASDHGAKFKVEAKLGAETVVSDEATLTVLDLAAPTNPQISYNFDNGLPAGAEIGGTYPEGATPVAFVDTTGGVNDSGVLKLTTSENSQAGGFRSPLILEGAQLLDFTFAADLLAGNGTATPADGFSINIGSDVPITAAGEAENGSGTGITIAFDTYDNGGGEAPSIDVRYQGQVVVTKIVPLALVNSGAYLPVLLRVKENGLLDLALGETVVYQGLQVPNYVPMSGVRIALYARTGGANASYWFDNVRLGATVPATVSITGEPSDALVLVGKSATFQVLVSNPQGITYQWYRNDVLITGATQSTYTTPALTLSDDGAGYSVEVKGPGNTVMSRKAIAGVMTKFDAGANPVVNLDFNDGNVPADGALFQHAVIEFAGGVNDSAYVQLTLAENDRSGSFLLNTPAGVTTITDFTATWMMRVGGGTATPADGWSFVLGADIADGSFGEDGAGSGLVVSFDTYDNGTTEVAPEISVRYMSNDVATRPFDISVLRTGDVFGQIGVRVNRNGTLDLFYNETAVYRGLVLPNFTPFAAGRFGWGARTGGLNDNHWLDDVKIAINTQPVESRLTISLAGGNVTITWTGGGTLETVTALTDQWAPVNGATSGYTTPVSGTAQYFRVRQ